MKFIKEEVTPNKTRYMFSLGLEEAEIIFSLLNNAYRFMPRRSIEVTQDARRISNMIKIISNALPEFIEQRKND